MNRTWLAVGVLILGLVDLGTLRAEQLFQLRNQLVIRGTKAEIATLKEGFGAAGAGQIQVRPIWLVDDGLRRTYIHGRGMVDGAPIDIGDFQRTIEIWQPKPLGGRVVGGLGSVLGVSPFNEFGRRVITIRGPEGPVKVIQGITDLNSRYAKLIALKGKPTLNWDMRVATSSLPSSALNTIFQRRINPNNLDERLQVVQFYIAAERFDQAKLALQQTILDFPDQEADLKPQVAALTQRQADQLLAESETRAAAGQYKLARGILEGFPKGVGQMSQIQVEDALKALDEPVEQSSAMITLLRQQITQLDPGLGAALQPIVDEIADGLSADTISRMADYAQFGGAENLPLDNRVALAVGGWLLGSGSGEQNLTVAISLVKVRDLVAEYLGSSDQIRRQQILDELHNLEGAEPAYVDRMLPLLAPPLAFPEGSESETVPGLNVVEQGDARYLIQLPPEYNPLRRYPCILALHESRSSPEAQLDWWAGSFNEAAKMRRGHASRHGFIVVAPVWSRPGQREYEYTPQEHQRVLVSMRDAMRRAAIDSDRVFLVGHGEGATAAWDMALAHPDLFAGMISISGNPSKTVPHYEPNSRYVPLYMVMGELDASRADGSIIDDYMSFNHDAMVVMYRGRGREYFYDEVHRMFEWMQLPAHNRRPMPTEIETATIRHGDQFYWWLELGELKPDVAVDPILWNQAKRIRAGKISASIGTDNQVRVSNGPTETFRVMLRPQPGIDLNEQVIVRFKSRPIRADFDGSLEFMLEDARRRADRKRPFWMQISVP